MGTTGDLAVMTPAVPDVCRGRRVYDHRVREHVVRCGAKTVARHVQIPRSTVSTWRRRGLRQVVTTEPVGQDLQRALDSRAHWEGRARLLAAVVRLLLALLRASGCGLDRNRLPEGEAKARILRAISSAEDVLPLAINLRILRQETGWYYSWRRAENACQRFVLSIKRECLDRMVPLGERHLRGAISEYMAHYHRERNHLGLGNALIDGAPTDMGGVGHIVRRGRLGGLLSFYHRKTAVRDRIE